MEAARIPSQAALARLSGVPQPTINRILKGSGKKGPESGTLTKLAAACNVTFEWLHEGTGAPPTPPPAEQGDRDRTMEVQMEVQPGATETAYSLSVEKLLMINAIDEREAAILRMYRLATERGKEIIQDTAGSVPKQRLVAVIHDKAQR